MLFSIVKEYGYVWLFSRSLYSMKLKTLALFPFTEKFYEKEVSYPKRIDLFEIDQNQIKKILDGLSNCEKKLIIDRADRSMDGKILGFSSIELDYGNTFDWQLNPVTGHKCDITKKWYQIPDFDKKRGDMKLVWEASRFSHFPTFARAFYLTEDTKYYHAFKSQLANWLQHNPYAYGANYKCGQECSIRLSNAMLTYAAFYAAGQSDHEMANLIKELVFCTYKKVLGNFFYAYRCIKNDHTFSELMGMVIGAWCCGDGARLKWAEKVLNEIICEQFTEDGGCRSFSFNYEREIFQDLECILCTANKTGITLTADSKKRLEHAALLLHQCQSGNGQVPNYGPNDGALIFQVSSCKFKDYRPSLNTLYALLSGRELYEAGKHQEELAWFLNGKKIGQYAIQKIERSSSCFKQAGLFTIRGRCTWAMIVLNDFKSRAGHMDQLHFDLWIDDVNVFCDAGTYSYADNKGKKFLDNYSHNTVKVKGTSQMNTHGVFMVYDWTKRAGVRSNNTCFQGEMISKNGYSHRRSVSYDGRAYKITDKVSGTPGKQFWLLFHTPCELQRSGNTIKLLFKRKTLCEISSDLRMKTCPSERSLSYLQKEGTKCIYMTGHIGEVEMVHTKIKVYGGSEWLT